MKKALKDLSADPDVLAIYLAGSLAKGNYDHYSDIDLHTIVISERKADFLKGKRDRANNWGNVSFHEDYNPSSPYVVTHYDTFVKVDSWYHSPEESAKQVYKPSPDEVEHWRGKLLAFVHEPTEPL